MKWPAIAASIVIIGTLVAFALPKDAKYFVEPFEPDLVKVGAPTTQEVNATSWAEIAQNGVVLRIIVASYETINSGVFGDSSNFVATYPGKEKRGNYAGKGYIYDQTTDQFLPPKKYNSWIASTTAPVWDAPINKPRAKLKINEDWFWDKSQENWVKINITNYASTSNQQ